MLGPGVVREGGREITYLRRCAVVESQSQAWVQRGGLGVSDIAVISGVVENKGEGEGGREGGRIEDLF